ncbi:MarR family winged helix-turn-helix transcriptional regulator [Allonocardiopsis opalescens]|uniref:DNA-binding MarR family transcriptional regulator n=1 Tax=Allonocardiopsis opalescens TaxID=1144618 RepID=A0A2T0Q966_9ACTN|nr:MarR family transcriptional regulator [Allonocardiopsis opalescens]PRY00395.1 DNA-binding MarR family transcriptional regulator [Allonocardiopsis opalescens]
MTEERAGPGAVDDGAAAAALAEEDIDAGRLRVVVVRLGRLLRRSDTPLLTPTQMSALVAVESAGPMRLGDLAAHEGITPSTLTRLVTSLEESGYVRRQTDPRDARSSRVSITDSGRLLLDRVRRDITELLQRRIARLPAEQRRALNASLPALEAVATMDLPDPRP